MRKAFNFIPMEDVVTPVFDEVSMFVPDQSLSLRDIMTQFAYIGSDRMSEIVNCGFIGDEDDDDVTGEDINTLDFAEVHDRLLDFMRPIRKPAVESTPEPTPEPAAPADGGDAAPA